MVLLLENLDHFFVYTEVAIEDAIATAQLLPMYFMVLFLLSPTLFILFQIVVRQQCTLLIAVKR